MNYKTICTLVSALVAVEGCTTVVHHHHYYGNLGNTSAQTEPSDSSQSSLTDETIRLTREIADKLLRKRETVKAYGEVYEVPQTTLQLYGREWYVVAVDDTKDGFRNNVFDNNDELDIGWMGPGIDTRCDAGSIRIDGAGNIKPSYKELDPRKPEAWKALNPDDISGTCTGTFYQDREFCDVIPCGELPRNDVNTILKDVLQTLVKKGY